MARGKTDVATVDKIALVINYFSELSSRVLFTSSHNEYEVSYKYVCRNKNIRIIYYIIYIIIFNSIIFSFLE